MLQVIVFALLLGLALSRAGAAGDRIGEFFADLNEVMMKLITMVIQLTPYGVFCLMVKLGASVGWVEIGKVLAYFLTVASALILHGLIVYPTRLSSNRHQSTDVFAQNARAHASSFFHFVERCDLASHVAHRRAPDWCKQ